MEIQPVKGLVGAAGMVVAFFLWQLYRRRRERRML
jgi:hypothetical protein